MAISATAIWEVETGGSDTANGASFDPGQSANFTATGAITSPSTSAPVLSSSAYNFVSGDVGAWVHFPTQTNITAGWYKIASVAANAATLTATAGAGVLRSTMAPTTAVGVGTATSGVTFSVDYSQQTTAQYTLTGLTTAGASATVVYASASVNMVGNGFVCTGGTNFTTGYYTIVSVVAGTSFTVDRNVATGVGAAGTGNIGGAMATHGMPGSVAVAGNSVFIQSGSYSMTSATNNVAGGGLAPPVNGTTTTFRIVGYGSVRGDLGTKPVITASGINAFTIITGNTGNFITNISVSGGGLGTGRGISGGNVTQCTATACTNGAFYSNSTCDTCYGYSNTVSPAFQNSLCFNCVAASNNIEGFLTTGGSGVLVNCISINNTGSSGHGFAFTAAAGFVENCVAYGNAQNGFHFASPTASQGYVTCRNCIAESNTGTGYNVTAAWDVVRVIYCAAEGNGTNYSANISTQNIVGFINYTGSAFVSASGNNFALNSTAGAGALLQNAGYPSAFAGISTLTYPSIGAQQPSVGGSSSSSSNFGFVIANGAPMIGDW
jgi:hypothetical protein